MIHPDLVELIRCPKCRARLELRRRSDADGDGDGLVCASCLVVYPIVDDLPQLLVEEARPVAQA